MALAVEDVALVRRDVEVAADHRGARQVPRLPDPRRERVQPAELHLVLRRADRLPVRHVDVEHAEAAKAPADHAGARVGGTSVESAGQIRDRLPRDEGDAVPGLLAEDLDAPALLLERRARERLVVDLDFLHAEEVRILPLEPGEDAIEARAQRVHVPGRNPHRRRVTGPAGLPGPCPGRIRADRPRRTVTACSPAPAGPRSSTASSPGPAPSST